MATTVSQRYAPHYTITVLVKGLPPKRNGRNPYAVYKTGMTVAEFQAHPVAKAADLWWDEKNGHIRINRHPPKKAKKAPRKPATKALVKALTHSATAKEIGLE